MHSTYKPQNHEGVMISFIVRIFAVLALLGAVMSGLIDAANSMASSKIIMSSMESVWQSLTPSSYSSFQLWVQNTLGSNVWNNGFDLILQLPAWLVLLLISFLLFFLSKK